MSGDRSNLGFVSAEEFRRLLRIWYPREDGWTHERIGNKLKLSAGFVGMLLDGSRKPSKAILNALKMEAVTLYRFKNDPFTGRPWGLPPDPHADQIARDVVRDTVDDVLVRGRAG